MAGTTIWQARKGGWSVTLKCARTREGLKSAKPCMGEARIDLSTLIAAFGPDVAIDALQTKLMCPSCGTRQFELRIVSPLSASQGPAKLRRGMRPVQGRTPTLAEAGTWVVVKCDKCGRAGEYRTDRLLAEFDGAIRLPTFLEVFAQAKGCQLARPNPTKLDLAEASACRIGYVFDHDA